MSALDKLERAMRDEDTAAARAAEKAEARYWQAVEAIAGDIDVDLDELNSILGDAGRGIEQARVDVALLREVLAAERAMDEAGDPLELHEKFEAAHKAAFAKVEDLKRQGFEQPILPNGFGGFIVRAKAAKPFFATRAKAEAEWRKAIEAQRKLEAVLTNLGVAKGEIQKPDPAQKRAVGGVTRKPTGKPSLAPGERLVMGPGGKVHRVKTDQPVRIRQGDPNKELVVRKTTPAGEETVAPHKVDRPIG